MDCTDRSFILDLRANLDSFFSFLSFYTNSVHYKTVKLSVLPCINIVNKKINKYLV